MLTTDADTITPTQRHNTTVKTVDGQLVTIFAQVKDRPGVLAVAIPPRGATMFFCQLHRRAFPHNGDCPECGAEATKKAADDHRR